MLQGSTDAPLLHDTVFLWNSGNFHISRCESEILGNSNPWIESPRNQVPWLDIWKLNLIKEKKGWPPSESIGGSSIMPCPFHPCLSHKEWQEPQENFNPSFPSGEQYHGWPHHLHTGNLMTQMCVDLTHHRKAKHCMKRSLVGSCEMHGESQITEELPMRGPRPANQQGPSCLFRSGIS